MKRILLSTSSILIYGYKFKLMVIKVNLFKRGKKEATAKSWAKKTNKSETEKNRTNSITKTTGNAKRILHFTHSHHLVLFPFWSVCSLVWFFFLRSYVFAIRLRCKCCMHVDIFHTYSNEFQPMHFSLAAVKSPTDGLLSFVRTTLRISSIFHFLLSRYFTFISLFKNHVFS